MRQQPQDSTPIPDPTRLTTDAVDKSVVQLRLDIDSHTNALKTRLDGIDEATRLRLEGLKLAAENVDKNIQHLKELHSTSIAHLKELHSQSIDSLKELHAARFHEVQTQFDEKDKALNAALQASKESSEEAKKTFKDQIEKQANLFETTIAGMREQNNDVRDRMTRFEGVGLGGATAKEQNWLAIGIVLSVTGIIITILVKILT